MKYIYSTLIIAFLFVSHGYAQIQLPSQFQSPGAQAAAAASPAGASLQLVPLF